MTRLDQIAQQIKNNSQPPVHLWSPAECGEIDIRIDAQGQWFHEGELISRDALVALFASILWAEDGQYYLVTPAEKLLITVADVPYVIHQAQYLEGAWVAVTNTHEQVIISADNPVQLRQYEGNWLPYVRLRYDLWARVNRSIYYQWVDMALDSGDEALCLNSNGYQFAVAKM